MVAQPIIVTISGMKETHVWFKKNIARFPTFSKTFRWSLAENIRKFAIQNIKSRAKQRTGRLEDSIHIVEERTSKTSGRTRIMVMTPYAADVEDGTKPHFIPFGMGKPQGVNHPGSKAMRYMRDAVIKLTQSDAVRDSAKSHAEKTHFFK